MRNNNIYHWNPRNTLYRLLFSAIYVALAGGLFYACDNFVDVDQPGSQLTAAAVFENKATANAAMTDIYAKVRDRGLLSGNSSGLSHALGLYGDELELFETSDNSNVLYYNNALQPGGNAVKELWNSSYNQIYSANAVLEGVARSKSLTDEDKGQLKGEALFVRALVHFYLANVYGSVPYITTTDYVQNKTAAKLPTAEVYAKAKADLELAASLLPPGYGTEDRTRPNSFAARALLARLDLYAGSYDEAGNEASAVLNQTDLYVWESDLQGEFLKGSPTTIWALAETGGSALEAVTFVFTAGPPPLAALSSSMMVAFEPGDQRRAFWTAEVSDGTTSWYHAAKYKDNTGSGTENSVVLRLAEMYLVRAEARARVGELIGAKEDLDKVRNKAGLAGTTAVTQAAILQAILQERRVELFTEFGHRFFDLKRFGVIDAALTPVKPGWNPTDALFPIPETELLVNPNIRPQNAGY